jgi:lauroyl/myristoyl acyltransferase
MICLSNIKTKQIAVRNIKLVFPTITEKELQKTLYFSFKTTCINFINGLFGRCLFKTRHIETINFEIPRQFFNNLENNGIVLVTHHGGMVIDSKYMGTFLKKKCIVVIKKQFLIDKLLYSESFNYMKYIDKTNCFKKLLVCDSTVIVIACDQKAQLRNKSDEIIFLGQKTAFHFGPAILSQKTKRKIWFIELVYDFKTLKQTWKLYNISEKVGENATAKNITQAIADVFSESIITNKYQYFWSHNRFRLLK